MAVAELVTSLQEQRDAELAELDRLMAAATTNKGFTAEAKAEFEQRSQNADGLSDQIKLVTAQAEREQRAAASRAQVSGGQGQDITSGTERRGSGFTVGNEPMIYGRGSGHSYFLDLARDEAKRGDGDGGLSAARDRLSRHSAELRVEMPKRAEKRAAAAQRSYERAFEGANTAEKRAMDRMQASGVTPFERRFISRTDGAGGYFVPPLWLIDQYIEFLRAGRDFANLWRGMELPSGTDNINIPRVTIGTGTGPQVTDGGPVPGRDMTDSFVSAPVRTIAGQQDAALQLLDQSPLEFDQIIFGDLAADYNLQLSGQLYVGSGTAGQLTGVWPGGVISTANGIYIANTNNTAAQTWVNGGGATPSVVNSVFQGTGQMLSVGARTRLRPFTHHVWHPWVWYYLLTQVDGQQRPLVVPGTPQNMAYNQVAVDSDGPLVSGPAGYYQGLPVILDPNMPVTFPASGGTLPQIASVSNGQFAAAPGSGVFTPLLAGNWDDLFLWEGEMRSRALSEVLSGNLQVRFQIYNYVAALSNRYQAYSTVQTGSGPTTVAQAGASVSFATLTQYSGTAANSVLNMMGQGF
jgi:HK97 family phage major capsid protein